MMLRFFNRITVYCLYCLEYIRHSEWASLKHAVKLRLTGKSDAKGGVITSSMGIFKTRPYSLDFQYINYAYEIQIKRFIEQQDFTHFLDVGACLGEYSIWLGKKGKQCLAFEPVSASFNLIEQNIKLNNMEQWVKAYNHGLGQKQAFEHFKLNDTNPGANHRIDKPENNTECIKVFSLDEKLAELGILPDYKILMKIDVEGMELEVLEGASNFITNAKHLILIIEEVFSGGNSIREKLREIADFEFGKIDKYNIYARKILQ